MANYNNTVTVNFNFGDAANETSRIKNQAALLNKHLERSVKLARQLGQVLTQVSQSSNSSALNFAQKRFLQEQRLAAQHQRQIERIEANAARQRERLLNQELRQRERLQAQAENRRRSSSSGGNSLLAGAAGGAAFAAVSGLGQTLKDGASELLRFSGKLETTAIAFETMTGSVDRAQSHIADLMQFAKTTPFNVEGLIAASQQMQALGFRAEQVIPILNDVGNAVAGAGGGNDRLERVIRALSQIQAKGRVQGQELLQLAEAGIPAIKILQQELGKSAADVLKLVEKGEVGADRFLKAFQKFSQANFGDLMQRQSRTFEGALSNIYDTLRISGTRAFEPFYNQIRNIAVRTADELEGADFSEAINIVSLRFGELGGTAARSFTASYISNFGKNYQEDLDDYFKGRLNLSKILKREMPVFTGIFEGVTGLNLEADDIKNTELALQRIIKQERLQKEALNDSTKAAFDNEQQLKSLDSTLSGTADQAKRITEVFRDAANRLAVFGNNSREASVRQQLLEIDIAAVNTALGQQAIALARSQDEQGRILEQQRNQIEGAGDSFRNITGVIGSLSKAIADATFGLKTVDFSPSVMQARKFTDEINELESALSTVLGSGLIDAGQAAQARSGLDSLRTLLTEFEATATTAARGRGVKAFKEYTDGLKNLVTETRAAGLDETGQNFLKFGERLNLTGENGLRFAEKMPAIAEQLERLGSISSSTAAFNTIIDNLLTNVGVKSAQLEPAREALLKYVEALKELRGVETLREKSEKAKQDARDAEAKGLERLREQTEAAAEQMRELYDETKGFFTDVLGFAVKGDFKGLFSSITDRFKDNLIGGLSDVLSQSVLGFSLEDTKNPVLAENVKQTNLLATIAANTGSGVLAEQNVTVNAPNLGNFGQLAKGLFGLLGIGGSGRSGGGGGGTSGLFGSVIGAITGRGGQGVPMAVGNGQTRPRIVGQTMFNPSDLYGSAGRNWFSGGGSGGLGAIFGKGGIFGEKGFGFSGGRLSGTIGGLGTLASIAGGLIGGKVGGAISGAASGALTGLSIGGPWGALIGGGIGLLGSLLGGDPKRKADKKQNLPALQKGFSDAIMQMNNLIADVERAVTNPLSVDPSVISGALGRAREIRGEIASGFGIEFQSKKYRKQAQTMIASKLSEFDSLMPRLEKAVKAASEILGATQERERRLVPEFATGAYLSSGYLRRNGMLYGGVANRDSIRALLMPGEMVLNQRQQLAVRRAAGFDAFASAQIPNYSAAQAVAAPVAMQTGGMVNSQPQVTQTTIVRPVIEVHGVTFNEGAKAYLVSEDGQREVIEIVKTGKRNGELR